MFRPLSSLAVQRLSARGLLLSTVHPQARHSLLSRAAQQLCHQQLLRNLPVAFRFFTTTTPRSPTKAHSNPTQLYPPFPSAPVSPLTPATPAAAAADIPLPGSAGAAMDIAQLNAIEAAELSQPQHDTNTDVSPHAAQSPLDDEAPPLDLPAGAAGAHLTFTDVPLSAVLAGKAKYGSAVHAVYDTDRISTAMALMRLFGIGAVLVRSSTPPSDVVGIVSTRDYIDRVADGAHPTAAPVTHYMTEAPVFAYSDEPAIHALELMTKHSFRHLPVRRRCCGGKGAGVGEVIGLVSIGDLVRVMLRQYRESNGFLKDYIDGKYR